MIEFTICVIFLILSYMINNEGTLTFQRCSHLLHLSDMPLKRKRENECPTVTSVDTAISIYAIVTQGQHTIIHLILNHRPGEWWQQRFFFFLRVSVRPNLGWVTQTATGAGGGYVRGLWRTERQSSEVVWLGFSGFWSFVRCKLDSFKEP